MYRIVASVQGKLVLILDLSLQFVRKLYNHGVSQFFTFKSKEENVSALLYVTSLNYSYFFLGEVIIFLKYTYLYVQKTHTRVTVFIPIISVN